MASAIDGYTLAERLRRSRRRHPLTATEQALYYELVAICNEVGWEDEFPVSNDELCASLCISEKTLNTSRMALINAGVIFYASGKSKRQYSRYSFTKELTTVKFTPNTTTKPAPVPGGDPAPVPEDYSIGQTESKTETESEQAADPSEIKAPKPHFIREEHVAMQLMHYRNDISKEQALIEAKLMLAKQEKPGPTYIARWAQNIQIKPKTYILKAPFGGEIPMSETDYIKNRSELQIIRIEQ